MPTSSCRAARRSPGRSRFPMTDMPTADGDFLHEGVPVRNLALTSDLDGEPTLLELGALRLCVIDRGGRLAIRTWDTESAGPDRVRRHRPLAGGSGVASRGASRADARPDDRDPGRARRLGVGGLTRGSRLRGRRGDASAPGASRAVTPASCGWSSATRRTAARRTAAAATSTPTRPTPTAPWSSISTGRTTRPASSRRTRRVRCRGRRTACRSASRPGSEPTGATEPPSQASRRSSSRSRSRSMERSVSSAISPRSRSSSTARRSALMTERRISSCSSSSTSSGVSSTPEVPVVGVTMHDVLAAMLVSLLQLVQQRQVAWSLGAQLLDSDEGRLGGNLPRVELLVRERAVIHDAEPSDERTQGQPLADERREDHGEREEDHEAAPRQRFAGRGLQRQGQRGGQRERSAHAAPAEDERDARRRRRIPAGERGDEPARQVGRRIHPHQAHRDDRDADRRRQADELTRTVALEVRQHGRKLQADEQEGQAVHDEDQHLPHRCAEHARARPQDARRPIADEEPGGDDREHAGEPQLLGRDVGGERGQQADEDLHRRVVDEADELRGAPADDEPEDRPADWR